MRKDAYLIVLTLILSVFITHPLPYTANAYDSRPIDSQANSGSHHFVQPIIYHPDTIDEDFNGIQDSLEAKISHMVVNGSAAVPVIVTLYNPVLKHDLDYFVELDGRVTHVYRHVTYGFAGVIPVASISKFASLEKENLCVIEHDAPIRYYLEVSVPLIRARPTVWNTYGYTGFLNQSIAIIDTGIDDSHLDVGPFGDLNFSRKMVGWYDATADGALTPQDYGEHGTHCAGIAAGTGTANSPQGSGNIETTFTYVLPEVGYGYIDYIDVMNSGVIELNCSWRGNNNVLLRLYNPTGSIVAETSGRDSPLILTYNTTGTSYPTGRYQVVVGNLGGRHGNPFSCIETYPYQGLNDGYGLFTGVAPNSRLVGVKVFDNTGSGTISTLIAGMDWVIQNRISYGIVVASMSVGLVNGETDSTLDQKADTMVNYGVVTTVAAGNDFPNHNIGSPGTAAYVITVAATNDQNGVTSYSSNGDTSKNEYALIKPDVAAPGGTFQTEYGNRIISADSNDVDAGYTGYTDQNADDYQQMAGTSMSTPHVAGLAALIIQAFGGWNWTQDEALKVKMIISMTAFEVQSGESSNVPPLNRGDKDKVEGYGRVCADAAIEAATMTYTLEELANDTLGSDPSDKKVWARQVSLSAGTRYEFHLSVPSDADYDLYLYNGSPDSYGQPVILEKSVNASSGAEETIYYTPAFSDTHYILVKWVGGGGVFNLTSTVEEHDVAIVSVTSSAAKAYIGQIVNVTVVVINKGNAGETFNVTAFYNETAIGTQTVTALAPEANVTLTFAWNTTNAPYGYYVISATAEQVPGETDLSDNKYVDGTVQVRIPGDANGDGVVNIIDLGMLGGAWGSKTGDSNYDACVDFNGDGTINIIDLGILGSNWGWKER